MSATRAPALQGQSAPPISPAATEAESSSSFTRKTFFQRMQDGDAALTRKEKSLPRGLYNAFVYARLALPGLIGNTVPAAFGVTAKVALAFGAPYFAEQGINALGRTLDKTYPELADIPRQFYPLALRAIRIGLCPEVEIPAMLAVAACHWLVEKIPEHRTTARWLAEGAATLTTIAVQEVSFQIYSQRSNLLPQGDVSPVAGTVNGSVKALQKPVNQLVVAATHDSASVPTAFANVPFPLGELGKVASNQLTGIDDQFSQGVRGYLLGVCEDGGSLLACHGPFKYGQFGTTLSSLARNVAADPTSFVFIQIEGELSVPSQALAQSFNQSGLGSFMNPASITGSGCVDTQGDFSSTQVQSLMSQGIRVFWNCVGGYSETAFDVRTLDQLDCSPDAVLGSGQSILDLNAFGFPFPGVSAVMNAFLRNTVLRCAAQAGRLPNIVAVNHFRSAFGFADMVRQLNEIG